MRAAAGHRYRLFGLDVQSEIDLGDLPEAHGPEETDVHISRADIPHWNSMPEVAGFEATPDRVSLNFPDIGRFEITRGTTIRTDTGLEGSAALRWRLLGLAFGVLLHQRGLLPLHATVVSIGGLGVGFVGHSGAGKSTMAAYLMRRGHRLLIDDVSALSFHHGAAWAAPGYGRIRLLGDAIDALKLPQAERLLPEIEKFELMADRAPRDPVRLDALVELRRGGQPSLDCLDLHETLELSLRHTYCRMFVKPLGRERETFQSCSQLAGAVRAFALTRPIDLSRIEESVALLEQAFL